MNLDEILSNYVGELNTGETREIIRTELINAVVPDGSSSMRDALTAWQAVSGSVYDSAINTSTISTHHRNNNDISEYGRSMVLNYDYADSGSFLNGSLLGDGFWASGRQSARIQSKMVKVGFVQIVSNPNDDESPFMCTTGQVTIEENSEKFFEDIEHETIKRELQGIILNIVKANPANGTYILSQLGGGSKRWICKRPLKAVDMIKEFLDESFYEMTQRFFAVQKKLQHFRLVKG